MSILLALGAAVGYGSADFLGGLASRRASANIVVVLSQLAGLGLLLVLLPFVPGRFDPRDLGWGVTAGLCGGIGLVALFGAFRVGRMGVVSPISAVMATSVPVVFGIALGEHPSAIALVGVGLAVLAIALVSTNADVGSFSLREPGVLLALLSGVLIGGLYVSLSRSHHDTGLWLLLTMRVTSIMVVGVYCLLKRESFRRTEGALGTMIWAGVIDMSANVLYLLATRYGYLAIVAVITCLYPAATVFLARIVLHERLTRLQWVGVTFAAGGLALLSI